MTRPPYALDLSPETATALLSLLDEYIQTVRAETPRTQGETRYEYGLRMHANGVAQFRGLLRFHAEKGRAA
jgi:hypothetical protein